MCIRDSLSPPPETETPPAPERLRASDRSKGPPPRLLDEIPVYYYIFDVLYADGRDTRALPQIERKSVLADALDFSDPLRFTEHRARDGVGFFGQACADGWEGLIAKRAAAPYVAGRTRDWLKFKCLNGQEFVIGGYTDPQRSRVGFGALLLGYYDADGLGSITSLSSSAGSLAQTYGYD